MAQDPEETLNDPEVMPEDAGADEEDEEEVGQGCIEGMRCPECGQATHFNITGRSTWEVEADGSDCIGDVEWDDDDSCTCPSCGHCGAVRDFLAEPEPEDPLHPEVFFRDKSHWEDHPSFPAKYWRQEVANGDTRLGYQEWCLHQWEAKPDGAEGQ